MNCENQEWIQLKFHKFSSFIYLTNSKWNGIVGGKLVRPGIPSRVCFWPANRDRLPTPCQLRCMLEWRSLCNTLIHPHSLAFMNRWWTAQDNARIERPRLCFVTTDSGFGNGCRRDRRHCTRRTHRRPRRKGLPRPLGPAIAPEQRRQPGRAEPKPGPEQTNHQQPCSARESVAGAINRERRCDVVVDGRFLLCATVVAQRRRRRPRGRSPFRQRPRLGPGGGHQRSLAFDRSFGPRRSAWWCPVEAARAASVERRGRYVISGDGARGQRLASRWVRTAHNPVSFCYDTVRVLRKLNQSL